MLKIVESSVSDMCICDIVEKERNGARGSVQIDYLQYIEKDWKKQRRCIRDGIKRDGYCGKTLLNEFERGVWLSIGDSKLERAVKNRDTLSHSTHSNQLEIWVAHPLSSHHVTLWLDPLPSARR